MVYTLGNSGYLGSIPESTFISIFSLSLYKSPVTLTEKFALLIEMKPQSSKI